MACVCEMQAACPHELGLLRETPKYKNKREEKMQADALRGKQGSRFRALQRCSVCSEKASHYCIPCSANSVFVAICNPFKPKQHASKCYAEHIQQR